MTEVDQIIKLSVAERILAVEKIWESITPEDLTTSQPQKDEMSRRLARYREGKTKFFTWEEVKSEMHKK